MVPSCLIGLCLSVDLDEMEIPRLKKGCARDEAGEREVPRFA